MERGPAAPRGAPHDRLFDPAIESYRVRDLCRYLEGSWRLARVIEDRRGGQAGVLRGQARFEAHGGGLVLSEAGRLRLGAHAGPAHRRYLYRFPAPGRAEVGFADGRPFHALDLSDGAWAAEHRCDADLYRGAFWALDPHTWVARWVVAGPRKDAVLTSRYRRRPAGAAGRSG